MIVPKTHRVLLNLVSLMHLNLKKHFVLHIKDNKRKNDSFFLFLITIKSLQITDA